MNLSKKKFIEILDNLNIDYNEGINSDISANANPRLVFWDYVWEPIAASGQAYDTLVTYQVSYFSYTIPRESKELLSLLKALSNKEILVSVNHEYVEKDRTWHSYFSLDLLENILEENV